jgi:hypothetical protein
MMGERIDDVVEEAGLDHGRQFGQNGRELVEIRHGRTSPIQIKNQKSYNTGFYIHYYK